jgi:hypothetical protein
MLVVAPRGADIALLQPEPRTQAKTEEKEKDEAKDGLKP